MSDPLPFRYQPDEGVSRRKGENPRPAVPVDKPISMKMRISMRPNTKVKHYRRKGRKGKGHDDRYRTFY